jgi:hypothetical protein
MGSWYFTVAKNASDAATMPTNSRRGWNAASNAMSHPNPTGATIVRSCADVGSTRQIMMVCTPLAGSPHFAARHGLASRDPKLAAIFVEANVTKERATLTTSQS